MTKQPDPQAPQGDEGEIERSVLAYLRQHPLAADTLRGISNWWLPQQRYEGDDRRIGHALDRLVAQGVLHRDELPDGEVLYALNRHTKPSH